MLEKRFGGDRLTLGSLLLNTYGNITRNETQRQTVLQCIQKEYQGFTVDQDQLRTLTIVPPPFYLDEENNRLMQYILSLSPQQPILIVGPEGCGKSDFVQSLANLCQMPCRHLFLTPQTEPAALVGSLVPQGKAPVWQNGAVTEAVSKGLWLILENLLEVSPTVLDSALRD